ncbi:cyclic nucleotide-binding domain-containing protein [Myxococcota bacterium]|nr:cyclic nucleotide-binding domain-containing protein [Myxococcota bacterium]
MLNEAEQQALEPRLLTASFAAGQEVVTEADDGRAMYFVRSGRARITRDGLVVAEIGPGAMFGELGLITGRPRAATITAITDLECGVLTRDRYVKLTREAPELAITVLERMVDGLGDRLLKMTENVGTLLSERSLPRRTRIKVSTNGDEREVSTGVRLGSLLPDRIDGAPVVAALVEHTPASLGQPLSASAHVTPLTTGHWEGERILKNSIALLLLEAARRVDHGVELRLGPTLGFAQRIFVKGRVSSPELAADIEAAMNTLVRAASAVREEWWTVDEARDHFSAAGWKDAVNLLRTVRSRTVMLTSYGEVYVPSPGPLLPSTRDLGPFRVVSENGELILVYGTGDQVDRAIELARQLRSAMGQQDKWLETLGIISVGDFNEACIRGDVTEMIRVSEGFQEKQLGHLADAITARANEVKLVCISGPSSSGKTTFIKRLKVQLHVNGLRPVGLSLDDYYVDREKTPKGPDGDYDYEAVEALRQDLFDEHLSRLLAGEAVKTARYDFHTGRSHAEGGPTVELGPRDILMLEGIHALNPRLFSACPSTKMLRVFICPLRQLPFDHLSRMHVSDLRLIRRIVRDRHGRGHSAAANILRWPSVRAGERKHIFPFQTEADFIFDTSLIYELSVLKVYAERYLLEVPQDHDAYPTAHRLLRLLDHFVTIYPDHVPPTSFLREFIGNSGFEY